MDFRQLILYIILYNFNIEQLVTDTIYAILNVNF